MSSVSNRFFPLSVSKLVIQDATPSFTESKLWEESGFLKTAAPSKVLRRAQLTTPIQHFAPSICNSSVNPLSVELPVCICGAKTKFTCSCVLVVPKSPNDSKRVVSTLIYGDQALCKKYVLKFNARAKPLPKFIEEVRRTNTELSYKLIVLTNSIFEGVDPSTFSDFEKLDPFSKEYQTAVDIIMDNIVKSFNMQCRNLYKDISEYFKKLNLKDGYQLQAGVNICPRWEIFGKMQQLSSKNTREVDGCVVTSCLERKRSKKGISMISRIKKILSDPKKAVIMQVTIPTGMWVEYDNRYVRFSDIQIGPSAGRVYTNEVDRDAAVRKVLSMTRLDASRHDVTITQKYSRFVSYDMKVTAEHFPENW